MDPNLRPAFGRRFGYRWLAVFALFFVLTGCSASESLSFPSATDGTLDLTDWDWDKDGVVPLRGKWAFEWRGGRPTTLEVPGMWGETAAGDGRVYPGQGIGTYRLAVLHPPDRELLAIRVPNILTAYKMYVNDKLVMSKGRLGLNAEDTVPYQLPATVYLSGSGSRTDIRIEVGNFHHRNGGIRADLVMGAADKIEALQTRKQAQEFIVFGCLAMIGLYHIGLFALRRKETANLYFAALCLLIGLRMGLVGEEFIVRWFSWFDWEGATRIDYIILVLSGWAGLAYYQRMYPSELRRKWVNAIGGVGLILAGAATFLPTVTFTTWLPAYQIHLLFICVIIFGLLLLALLRKKEGAKLALIGMAGMAAALVNDMLVYNGWWRSVDMVPFGLLFLIIMNSFIIALKSNRTYERAEQMSAELKQWNDKLEERIAKRTEELRKSYETLEEAKLGLERMELSRRQLVSNISHDLRTPITLLQGYLEALRDGVISDDNQRDSTIRLMLGKVEGLNGLIHDLFELSVLEARRVELASSAVCLREWSDRLSEQYTLDLQEKNIQFECIIEQGSDPETSVRIDILRMDRVFANLLFNAVRYTPPFGTIRIRFRSPSNGDQVEVTVEDSGTGIHPDDLPFIFDRFYKKDKSRHSSSGGSGLGLAISREIVELHGGTIGAFNRPEGGGAFRILLPIEPRSATA